MEHRWNIDMIDIDMNIDMSSSVCSVYINTFYQRTQINARPLFRAE